MKIERLSENSIRCTLNRADLDSRELKISELAYGTEKAKSLFKDMIAQASFECGFEADDIPLMIEAIPVSPDCIILVITKVEDPEELDTRFSKFAPSDEDEDYADMLDSDDDMHGMDDGSSLLNRINEALNQDADFIPFSDSLLKKSKNGNKTNDKSSSDSGSKIIGGSASEKAEGSASAKKSSRAGGDKASSGTAGKKASGSISDGSASTGSDNVSGTDNGSDICAVVPIEKLFSFKDLNQATVAAIAVNNRFNGSSILYKNPVNLRYYLFIRSDDMNLDEFTGVNNTLSEYGVREKLSYATVSYLNEHDEVIIRRNAVKILAEL